ncbi:hypothetical protein [Tsuneonella mangrovi]|uniref:hypothetical protein n=1 Tax=Tsuneonella mangrovi TaxID=1982042 RepID=UPI000BA1E6D2|nr:hypothetical protein [Tsuneonella mangrovi]
MKFAARVYRWAAIYGIASLLLAYLRPVPDPWHLTYLAFVGVALVFQGVFLVIARDPVRFEPLMPVTFFEKLCFGVPAVAFAARGQVELTMGVFGAIDLVLMTLFFIAWRRLRNAAA